MSMISVLRRPSRALSLIAPFAVEMLVLLHAGHAAAQARNPFSVGVTEGGGYYTGFAGWILAKQASFWLALSGAVRAVRTDGSAAWTIAGLSFAYGVFHAAGPGHGKAVVSSYLIANERALRRGLVISLLAALLQGSVAIALIGVLALVLHETSPVIADAGSFVEKISFAAIALFGLYLVWRKGAALLEAWRNPSVKTPVTASAFVCEACEEDAAHVHSAACGHFHMPDPRQLGADFSWKSAAMTVLAAGARPCSGAILVLVFALAQGLFLVGVGSTFAMSLGTALTTSALASCAVLAKDLALRFTRPASRRAVLVSRSAEFLAACLVLLFGVALLMGDMAFDI